MIETSVMYVSTSTHANVVRIEDAAIARGIATAGSVPKTKRRMISAPIPPSNVSRKTLGPVDAPCDSKIASRPVRWLVTPGGVAFLSAARAFAIGGWVENVAFPAG